ncbi:ComEA family DNA-binding protein [Granulosicoccus antarcticus]|uniref:ComE operon protein 1 n=1 Tax=Granulosicoccus antarcticus IMCC3135 TaxID=1192854 RepID=A0A2Z2P1H3_9GAMM|nr:ComE operon protein 1 [Granulosicoccus antarcticus IMCC3135]
MITQYCRNHYLFALTLFCLSVWALIPDIVRAGAVPAASMSGSGAGHNPAASSPGRHIYSRVGAVFELPDALPVNTDEPTDPPAMVNINTASVEELAAALPGIGPGKAQRIVEWRESNGPFQTIEQLLEVSGIGPKTLENIRPFVLIADKVSTKRHLRQQSREEDAVTLALGRVIRRAERDRSDALRLTDLPR